MGNISPYWWPCIPHSYHDLAVTCWRQDRDQRPSADDILKTLHDLERDTRDGKKERDHLILPKPATLNSKITHVLIIIPGVWDVYQRVFLYYKLFLQDARINESGKMKFSVVDDTHCILI